MTTKLLEDLKCFGEQNRERYLLANDWYAIRDFMESVAIPAAVKTKMELA